MGFTIVEVIVVAIMIATLAGLVTINLLNAHRSSAINTSIAVILSDIKYAQLKSMAGDTEGRGTISTYGIHFNTYNYFLFHGTYVVGDPSNFMVTLDHSLSFSSINLPSSEVVFANGDGSVVGFQPSQNTITIQDADGKQKTITINSYGVITQVN